jgi:hypothetical protein
LGAAEEGIAGLVSFRAKQNSALVSQIVILVLIKCIAKYVLQRKEKPWNNCHIL